MHPGGKVEVVAPNRVRPRDVEAFVAENREWIERARRKLKNEPIVDQALPTRIQLPAIDRVVGVTYGSTEIRGQFEDSNGQSILLAAPSAHRQKCRQALRTWLAGIGRAELIPWLRRLSLEIGIEYKKTQVRGQKTRWGSCSARGTISLNFCLLFLRPELVRYLFVHELCHRRHFNHSKRYWQLVERFVPDYKTLDRQLADAWRDVPGWAL